VGEANKSTEGSRKANHDLPFSTTNQKTALEASKPAFSRIFSFVLKHDPAVSYLLCQNGSHPIIQIAVFRLANRAGIQWAEAAGSHHICNGRSDGLSSGRRTLSGGTIPPTYGVLL
jgi:hypothetical protein